jgi:hypothetical protein
LFNQTSVTSNRNKENNSKKLGMLTLAFALLYAFVHAGVKSGTSSGHSTGGACFGEPTGYTHGMRGPGGGGGKSTGIYGVPRISDAPVSLSALTFFDEEGLAREVSLQGRDGLVFSVTEDGDSQREQRYDIGKARAVTMTRESQSASSTR